MTDGTSLTLGLQNLSQSSGQQRAPEVVLAENARVESAPREIRDLPENSRVRGTVSTQNNDGTVRIQTPRGDVDVRVSENQRNNFREGQSVEIRVSSNDAGQQQVRIQEVPTNQSSQVRAQSATPPPPQATSSIPPVDQAVIQNASRPIEIIPQPRGENILRAPEQVLLQILGSPQPATLEANATLRLLPVEALPNLTVTTQQPQTIQVLAQSLLPIVPLSASTENVLLPTDNRGLELPLRPVQNFIISPNVLNRSLQTFEQVTQQLGITNLVANQPLSQVTPQSNIVSSLELSFPVTPQETTQISVIEPRILPRTSNPVLSLSTSFTPTVLNVGSETAQILTANASPQLLGQSVELNQLNGGTQQLRLNVNEIVPNTVQIQNVPAALPQISIDQIAGVVTGFTETRFPILNLSTPSGESLGQYALNFATNNLSVGTHITFNANGEGLGIIPSSQNFQALGQSQWSVLEQIFRQILTLPPQTAQVAQQAIIPSVPSVASAPQFAASTLFFVAALVGGDFKNWLSDKAQKVLESHNISTEKLGRDFGQISRAATEAPVHDWRALSIPLMTQEFITRVDFYYRDENHSESEENDEKATRFVMDMSLTRMGGVQIDGLIRHERLDIVLRTERDLSPSMRQQLRQLYSSAIQNTAYEGGISFEGSPEDMIDFVAR